MIKVNGLTKYYGSKPAAKDISFEVKKGDTVLTNKYGGTEIKLDGVEYKILNQDDILAVIG